MDTTIVYLALVISGLAMGSFAGATVWRLRAGQLQQDKDADETIDKKEYKKLAPLNNATFTNDRSQCLTCHKTLAWYDLLPLVSWLSTGGKCRYCHEPIGKFEPLIELGVALLFVGSFWLWPESLITPIAISQFVIWLLSGVGLAILFAYDLKWFLLPNKIMFSVIGLAAISAALSVLDSANAPLQLLNVAGAVGILSGLYLALHTISKGAWIGFGDVKLGLALALLLADWQLAFIALFAANVIGCLVVIPGILSGKLSRKAHVPFGPLLIAGAIIAQLYGSYIINWYTSLTF